MRTILLMGFLLMEGVATYADHFSVVVDDIPRPVTIEFPEGFKLADTSEARQRREGLLDDEDDDEDAEE